MTERSITTLEQLAALDDFQLVLAQLVHRLRDAEEPGLQKARDRAADLLRRKGSLSPLRAAAQPQPSELRARVEAVIDAYRRRIPPWEDVQSNADKALLSFLADLERALGEAGDAS